MIKRVVVVAPFDNDGEIRIDALELDESAFLRGLSPKSPPMRIQKWAWLFEHTFQKYVRIKAMLIGMFTIDLLLMMYYVWAWFDNDYGKGFVIGKIVKLPLRAHLDHLYAYVLVFVLCDDNLETLTLYLNSTGLKCLKWVLNTTTVFRLVGINKPWMTWWRSYFCNFNLPLHNFWKLNLLIKTESWILSMFIFLL